MGLEALGLRAGEPVRFRRSAAARWQSGSAVGVEKDGSLRVTDARGAARALPLAVIEVAATGPRGGRGWEPLLDRALRVEQLDLFDQR